MKSTSAWLCNEIPRQVELRARYVDMPSYITRCQQACPLLPLVQKSLTGIDFKHVHSEVQSDTDIMGWTEAGARKNTTPVRMALSDEEVRHDKADDGQGFSKC